MKIEPITYSNKKSLWQRLFVAGVEYATGRVWVEHSYRKVLDSFKDEPHDSFCSSVLEYMNVTLNYDKQKLESLPTDRAFIVVCNHPFGILDGLALNHIMYHWRQDYKILTNHVLLKAEPVTPYLLAIDDEEGPEAVTANRRTIVQSMKHLKESHVLCIFPAGRLARMMKFGKPVEERPWNELPAHLMMKVIEEKTGKPPLLLPIYFEGQNSWLFRIFSWFPWTLMTRSLVLNEIQNKRRYTLTIQIGDVVEADALPQTKDVHTMLSFMRRKTMSLTTNPAMHNNEEILRRRKSLPRGSRLKNKTPSY